MPLSTHPLETRRVSYGDVQEDKTVKKDDNMKK